MASDTCHRPVEIGVYEKPFGVPENARVLQMKHLNKIVRCANALTDVRLGRDGKRYKLPTPEFTAADAGEVGAPANGPRSTARDNAC